MTLLLALALLCQEPEKKPEEKSSWEFNASVLAYRLREDRDYLQPTLMADHDRLHLEARYNYEDRDTASLWVGANFSFGEDVKLDVTPMLGGVFGQTAGAAPGVEATLTWSRLRLYSEMEYVLHFNNHHDNFFYTWSEATISPWDWMEAGFVIQRTRMYDNGVDVQRGLLVRFFYKSLEITGAYFNPDEHPVYVLGIGVGF
jgi:hypothetical protein